MKGSKEFFLEEREWMVVMSDTLYTELTQRHPSLFNNATVSYRGEHQYLMENNVDYRETYKTYREAKKELNEHKYQLRERTRKS